ncbi:MAG: hypothetical protein ACOY99_05925 [Pseudomonadota bacterium]
MNEGKTISPAPRDAGREGRPTQAQARYLRLGLNQAGGKLPLFDGDGQRIPSRTIQSCIAHGWCEPWFHNPAKPDWLVCKLTEAGRRIAAAKDST